MRFQVSLPCEGSESPGMWECVTESVVPLTNALWSFDTPATTKPQTKTRIPEDLNPQMTHHVHICQIPPNNNTNMFNLQLSFNFLFYSVMLTSNQTENHFYTLYNSVKTACKHLTSLVACLPTWFSTAFSTFGFGSCPLPSTFSFFSTSLSPPSYFLLIFLLLSSPAKKTVSTPHYLISL